MCENSAVKKITDMRRAGIRLGTERTRALLDALGSPDDKLKIIHVAGTNGKGSVCEYITQMLICAGYRTGTYTTPEVLSFYEQFRIDGTVDRQLADRCLAVADEAAEKFEDKPTAYERQTAAAFLMFAEAGCSYAVIECCMGGLKDTTNAVNKKEVAAITSVSLEHTRFLGGTLGEIAAHKAGIIKQCPAFISQCVPQEVRGVFTSKGATLSLGAENIEERENGTSFTCGGVKYFTHMLGCKQPYNAALAITVARFLGLPQSSISNGVERARIAGRLQLMHAAGRDYILDGAHNPESFIPLANFLRVRYAGRRRTLVYGCLRDKDVSSSLALLSVCAERVIAVTPPSYRAMDKDAILCACRAAFGDAEEAEDIPSALMRADGDVVAVCGSFTLIKEAKQWIEREQ